MDAALEMGGKLTAVWPLRRLSPPLPLLAGVATAPGTGTGTCANT